MMWCGVVTLFPEMFQAITEYGVTGRAVERGLLKLSCWDPRDYAEDRHKTVDDRPYGGGPGMVMGVYPLRHAIQAARQAALNGMRLAKQGEVKDTVIEKLKPDFDLGVIRKAESKSQTRASTELSEGKELETVRVVYVSPQGRKLDQAKMQAIVQSNAPIVFVSGRYEGIDERLIELEIDEEWSIGDYVLSGGELAVMVIIDALTRLIPGVLGHESSAAEDSFSEGLLDCPHYTRPEVVEGLKVPEVLLSGDHANIARWRLKQSLGRTWLRRPDLLEKLDLDVESQALLQEFIKEHV